MRLFVAVDVATDVRAALDRACEPLRLAAPQVRWVPRSRWHLTLVFLGSVEDADVGDVCEAVAAGCVGVAPFTLTLDGRLGTFRGAVLWAGLGDSRPLAVLAQRLRAALEGVVALPEAGRAFRAHLTLARVPRGAALPRAALDMRVARRSWRVTETVLYASRGGGGGGLRYEAQGRWSLGG